MKWWLQDNDIEIIQHIMKEDLLLLKDLSECQETKFRNTRL